MKKELFVILQSWVARNKFCCGLGVRAVRAGSIGRDKQRLGESPYSPPWEAEGLWPPPGSIERPPPRGFAKRDAAPAPWGNLESFDPPKFFKSEGRQALFSY